MTESRAVPGLPAGMPAKVRLVEVGPRDGLQNEQATVPDIGAIRWPPRSSSSCTDASGSTCTSRTRAPGTKT